MVYNTMRIDTSALRQVNADMANQNQAITALLKRLETNLESQMTGWSGTAKNLYEERKAEWNQAAADLNGILEVLAHNTGKIAANYENAESTNTQMWR